MEYILGLTLIIVLLSILVIRDILSLKKTVKINKFHIAKITNILDSQVAFNTKIINNLNEIDNIIDSITKDMENTSGFKDLEPVYKLIEENKKLINNQTNKTLISQKRNEERFLGTYNNIEDIRKTIKRFMQNQQNVT